MSGRTAVSAAAIAVEELVEVGGLETAETLVDLNIVAKFDTAMYAFFLSISWSKKQSSAFFDFR